MPTLLSPTPPARPGPTAAPDSARRAELLARTTKRGPTRRPQCNHPSGERAISRAIVEQVSTSGHRAGLGISDLRLCRKVFGFGSFEPLADERVKVGQRLLVYCELTGMQYEARDAGFVSRISSRVEVKPARGGSPLGARARRRRGLCRRRRRDYYVNYRVDLPKTLGPGSYRLRFLQTDLVAGSSTTTEIPLEITPDW